MSTIFLTGFPGFLGSRLVPLLLRRDDDARAACLVQPKFADLARERIDELVAEDPSLADRIELVEGDLTQPDLGIVDRAALAAETTEIYHLAAVYDLGVPRDVGMAINVEGTRNLLRFAEDCPRLERHHYVSTCYVSGRHCGPFAEEDLDVGQTFNNFYEETKYLAEVEVARARDAGMPTTIYRPGIVVGDSRTGATQKYDGPYFLINYLLSQPRWLSLLPITGDPTAVRFNIVPSDYVVEAIAALSAKPETIGGTYALADPKPLTLAELLDEIVDAVGHRVLRVRVSPKLAVWAARRLPMVQERLGVPADAIEYFTHPTHYLTTNAVRDLAGTDVSCPPATSYVATLVDYVKAHRDVSSAAMI